MLLLWCKLPASRLANSTPVRRLWQTVPPAGLPVTVDEARDACQSLYSGDDARLLQLIQAAVAHIDGADGVLGRAIMPQTWKMRVDNARYEIDIPLPPLIAVSSVSVISTEFVSTPVVNGYTVIGVNPATITLPADLAFAGAEITFMCGYATIIPEPLTYVPAVPESLRLAILMLVRHWYDHPGIIEVGRISMQPLPMAVASLLAPYRVMSV